MNNKKFCGKCGAEMDVAAAFCPKCGERAADPLPVAQTEPQSVMQSDPQFPQQPISQPNPYYQYHSKPAEATKKKVDVKRTFLSNIIPVVCMIIGIVLLSSAGNIRIPSDYISSYSMTEYVGGDAYNFIIEACLRGGAISGATATKGLYTAVGLLITCVSALKLKVVRNKGE